MKAHLYFTVFVFLIGFLLLPSQQVSAQIDPNDTLNVIVGDTMYVGWGTAGDQPVTYLIPKYNALRTAINGDTIAGGARSSADRVYKLRTNGFYWLSDEMTNVGFTLRIVAEPMSAMDGITTFPPVIQMTDTREDGSSAQQRILTSTNDVILKNIYISGRTTGNGAQGAYQPIIFAGNDARNIIDGCVFEHSNFSLVVFTGKRTKNYVINNKFRNLLENPPTQQWTGRGVSIWTDVDTVIMENNTFFNLGFTTFQSENGSIKYLRYNHNTIVNVGRGLSSGSGNWWQNAYFANNLVINGWWEGEGYNDIHTSGRDARNIYGGLYNIGILPASYGIESARRVVFTKTYAYLDPAITAKYGSPDTITRAWFLDPVAKEDYLIPYALGGPNDGHMYCADTVWLSNLPTGMSYYLTDADWRNPKGDGSHPPTPLTGATMLDSMWAFITQVRANANMITTFFYHPTEYNSGETWPLPENFSYTDASLLTAGTDGLPIGDLNWFPTQKATFEANQAQYVKQIQDLAGAVTIVTPVDKVEAEDGTVSGAAAVNTVSGFIYWTYNQVGRLDWTFTVPTGGAGYYSTRWLVNLDDQGGSQGMVLNINDVQINDKVLGWGGTPFSHDPIGGGSPTSGIPYGWIWITADTVDWQAASTFNLAEGTNTIGVKSGAGWNHLLFAEIDLAPMGSTTNDTIRCYGAEAVASGGDIAYAAIGIPWVPSKFKSVDFGGGGLDTLTVTATISGTYKLRLFGQNLSGSAQAFTVAENGSTIGTASLPYVVDDSSGNDAMTTAFTLTPGAHKIVISGANAKIDYVQLLSFVGVERFSDVKPYGFTLAQNYPNPFNPTTRIDFNLGKAINVKLSVYNILGQKVATLINNEYRQAGPQTVTFDANKLASGVYFYKLEAGSFVQSKKMLLIK